MLITTIVGNVTHLDVFGDITDYFGEETTPDQISFTEHTINIGGFVMRVENGRYAFYQALNMFDEPKMQEVTGFNMICQNTIIEGELTIGYHNTIGKYGFGYERHNNIPYRIKHLGNVHIGNEVEIGSNVCIDRGTVGSTVIGDYTKIDNQVHIAHNVNIGNGCLVIAGSVIGGSTKIGENCFIGINSSIKNGVTIGNNVTVGMGAIVLNNVPDNTIVKGLWK